MELQDIESQLETYIGDKGLSILKKKGLAKDGQLLEAALNVAKCVHLKSQLEGCTKLNYQIPATDVKLDLVKTDSLWSGTLISKSQTHTFDKVDNDSLCGIAFALGDSDAKVVSDENFVSTIKTLVKSHKPKLVSLTLNKSQFECNMCKSQIDLGEAQLCKCLSPLNAKDLVVSKVNDKTKITFSKNWNQFQLKHVLKLVTKSLLEGK